MRVLAALLEIIYPERCPACDAPSAARPGLCEGCAHSLYPLGTACPRCAEPESAPTPITCVRCLRHPPAFARAFAPYRYGGELAVALRRMKYGGAREAGRPELVRPLAALLAPALAERAAGADLIVPVPLHPARLRRRGFSQAQRLAEDARPPLPVDARALVRTRDTAEQAGLSLAERGANVRGAFAVGQPARVAGARILLVDDVLTTGATASACARAMLAAGARRVDVVTLARAEG